MNSIEEDIKILEDLAKILDRTFENNNCEQSRAIEHLIKEYKELEEENRIFALEGSRVSLKIHIDKNYIPVSLVEEKIEELIKEGRHYNANKIEVLQELLEKR